MKKYSYHSYFVFLDFTIGMAYFCFCVAIVLVVPAIQGYSYKDDYMTLGEGGSSFGNSGYIGERGF